MVPADFLPIALAVASAIAVAALAVGAGQDVERRQIPNRISLLVALSSVALLATLPPSEAATNIGLAAGIFAVGAFAFSCRLVGGGDVKLLAATTLWAGTALFSLLIVILSLAAVVIAVLMLASEHLFRRTVRAGSSGQQTGLKAPLPLGLAIAIGGVLVIMHRASLLSLG